MNIVGINISHHSSSCLIKNGKIVYFSEEERFSRKKSHSINYHDLKFYGIESLRKHVTTIDHLVFATYGREGSVRGAPEYAFRDIDLIDNNPEELYRKYLDYSHKGIEYVVNDRVIIYSILKQLRESGIKVKNVVFNPEEHHIHHAYNSLLFSRFNEAAILVMDGGGSFNFDEYYDLSDFLETESVFREKESIYSYSNKQVQKVFSHSSPSFVVPRDKEISIRRGKRYFSHTLSAGDLFNAVRRIMGFGINNEGKVMGLSSHYQDEFPEDLKESWFYNHNDEIVSKPDLLEKLHSLPYDFKVSETNLFYPSMLARKLQIESERLATHLICKASELTGTTNVILSGGYFMNCVNNFKYVQNTKHISIEVDPIPYDAGASLGAANQLHMKLTGSSIEKPDNLFLSNKY